MGTDTLSHSKSKQIQFSLRPPCKRASGGCRTLEAKCTAATERGQKACRFLLKKQSSKAHNLICRASFWYALGWQSPGRKPERTPVLQSMVRAWHSIHACRKGLLFGSLIQVASSSSDSCRKRGCRVRLLLSFMFVGGSCMGCCNIQNLEQIKQTVASVSLYGFRTHRHTQLNMTMPMYASCIGNLCNGTCRQDAYSPKGASA